MLYAPSNTTQKFRSSLFKGLRGRGADPSWGLGQRPNIRGWWFGRVSSCGAVGLFYRGADRYDVLTASRYSDNGICRRFVGGFVRRTAESAPAVFAGNRAVGCLCGIAESVGESCRHDDFSLLAGRQSAHAGIVDLWCCGRYVVCRYMAVVLISALYRQYGRYTLFIWQGIAEGQFIAVDDSAVSSAVCRTVTAGKNGSAWFRKGHESGKRAAERTQYPPYSVKRDRIITGKCRTDRRCPQKQRLRCGQTDDIFTVPL